MKALVVEALLPDYAGCVVKDIPTPNIDSIAAHGVRFTNGYVSCPVCSPIHAHALVCTVWPLPRNSPAQ